MAESMAGHITHARAPGSSPEVRLFRGFVWFVAIGGPALGLLIAAARWDEVASLTGGRVLLAVFLTFVAASSHRVRFNVGHQVHANVSTGGQ